ncbi:apolipoprotein D-like, partial [Poecilia formosa]|uniref:apolipoprotein D-like n=1 Tax=Poecilia formosa TaxID=48698 RepID=UPI0007B97DF9
ICFFQKSELIFHPVKHQQLYHFKFKDANKHLREREKHNPAKLFSTELLDDGTVRSAFGTVEVKDPAEPAKLEVTFSDVILLRGSYWLLSTDYDSYALVYSCKSYGLFHVELAWILSRQPTLPKDITEYLLSILSSIGVSVDKMVSTIQDEAYCSPMYQ